VHPIEEVTVEELSFNNLILTTAKEQGVPKKELNPLVLIQVYHSLRNLLISPYPVDLIAFVVSGQALADDLLVQNSG